MPPSVPAANGRHPASLLQRFSRRLSPGGGLALCLATGIAVGGCAGMGFSTVAPDSSLPPTAAHAPASMPVNGSGTGMGQSTGTIGIGIASKRTSGG
jgi:hypothetical protein